MNGSKALTGKYKWEEGAGISDALIEAIAKNDQEGIKTIIGTFRHAIVKRAKNAKEKYGLSDEAYQEMESVMLQNDLMLNVLMRAWNKRNNE